MTQCSLRELGPDVSCWLPGNYIKGKYNWILPQNIKIIPQKQMKINLAAVWSVMDL